MPVEIEITFTNSRLPTRRKFTEKRAISVTDFRRGFQANFSLRRAKTLSGTKLLTSPPRRETSRTIEEAR
jgi:hypothetical protein